MRDSANDCNVPSASEPVFASVGFMDELPHDFADLHDDGPSDPSEYDAAPDVATMTSDELIHVVASLPITNRTLQAAISELARRFSRGDRPAA